MSQTEFVKSVIRDRGLSAAEVGRLADVDESSVSRWLAGKRGLALDPFDRILDALKLRIVETAQRGRRRSTRKEKNASLPREV
jgi:transcriptional regulator with XRE-family HTH domain